MLLAIERRALGIVQEDDLPGFAAPAEWLRYLRGVSAELLRRVQAHSAAAPTPLRLRTAWFPADTSE